MALPNAGRKKKTNTETKTAKNNAQNPPISAFRRRPGGKISPKDIMANIHVLSFRMESLEKGIQ